MPRVPTTDAEFSFVATPMSGGLRLAGTVELAGLEAKPNWRRSRMLLERAANLLRGLPQGCPGRTPLDVDGASAEPAGFAAGARPLATIGRHLSCLRSRHVGMTAAPYTGKSLPISSRGGRHPSTCLRFGPTVSEPPGPVFLEAHRCQRRTEDHDRARREKSEIPARDVETVGGLGRRRPDARRRRRAVVPGRHPRPDPAHRHVQSRRARIRAALWFQGREREICRLCHRTCAHGL